MTQQEKAKAYDEALKYVRIYYTNGNEDMKMMMKTCFPVLVEESEDERIRKGIKSILEHYKESGEVVCPYPFVSIDEALAWLEKQQKPAWNEESEKIRKEIMDFIDTKTIDSDERRNRWFSYLEKYKPISFISLEDTKAKMSLIQYISELNQDVVHLHPGIETCNEWIAWLEKQGRCDIDCPQKYQDCSRPKTSNENIKNCIGMCLTDANEQRFKDYNTTLKDCLDWFEKQGEQKLAYIVEPKFKVGDWITNGRYTKLIVGINSNLPNYMFEDGTSKRIKDIDKNYHLWSIKDAKNGDILVTDDNRPFKFKGLLDKNHPRCPVAYYGIDLNLKLCMSNDNCWWTNHDVYPATKKQCDFLFDKLMNIQTNEY